MNEGIYCREAEYDAGSFGRGNDEKVVSPFGEKRVTVTAMGIAENSKGLVLAVASGVFIGASFILKKKGLKQAATHGTRAGLHPFYNLIFQFYLPLYACLILTVISASNEIDFTYRNWRLFLSTTAFLVGWHGYK